MILRHFPNSNTDYSVFHRENVVVSAKSSEISYSKHAAPLSIKTCFKGTEYYEINGITTPVEAGKYLVLNDKQSYSSYILSHQEVDSFCFFFRPGIEQEVQSVFENSNEKLLDNPSKKSPTPLFQNLRPSDSAISPLILKMYREICENNDSQIWLDEQANSLLEVLFREHTETLREIEKLPFVRQSTRIEIYRRLNIAKDYIEAYYDKPLNLNEVSQVACLSQFHFLRLFKSAFHQTPHQYLTSIRLHKASQMAKENKLSITDICFKVGFENLSSFSRLFRNHFNISPQEFRFAARK